MPAVFPAGQPPGLSAVYGVEGVADAAHDGADLLGRDDEGRGDLEDVVREVPQVHAATFEDGDNVEPGDAVGEVDAAHESDVPYVFHAGVVAELFEFLDEDRFELADAAEEVLALDDLEVLECDSRDGRVAGVGEALVEDGCVVACVELAGYPGGDDDAAQGAGSRR